MKNEITGIVLSGGKSIRMGQDKGLMLLAGKPLVTYAINTLKEAGCRVMISSNDKAYEKFGYPVISDIVEGIGPLGGVYTGLQASETGNNIVLSCDIPLIPVDLIRHLLKESEKRQTVVPVFKGHAEPLCGLYRKEATSIIKDMITRKQYKMQDLLKNLNTRYLKINPGLSYYHEKMFANVNHPDEVLKLDAWLSK